MFRSEWLWRATAVVLIGGIVGCGMSGDNKVAGTAKIKGGGPLPSGRVMFYPDGGGKTPNGEIQSDGTFTVGTLKTDDGAPAGTYTVVIMGAMEPETRTYSRSAAVKGRRQAAHPQRSTKTKRPVTSKIKSNQVQRGESGTRSLRGDTVVRGC